MHRFHCKLCDYEVETIDEHAVVFCSHKGRVDNQKPEVMVKVR